MSAAVVGRDGELAALDAAIDDLDGGNAVVVLVAGEPGLGKTTLLTALRERAVDRGITVLAGRSSVLGGGVAFAPVSGALARHLDALPGDERAALVDGLPDLATVVSGLGLPPQDDGASGDPEVARARLFQSVALLVARLSRVHPVLVVVDDLHWADVATVELLGHLADELASMPIGLALAHRPGDVGHRPDVRRLLADLGRRPGTADLSLGALDDDAIVSVASAALGGPLSPRLAEQIVGRACGVPLVADALARDLHTRGAARPRGPAWDAEPHALEVSRYVRDLFADRLDPLSEPTRLALATLAVVDRPAAASEVADVSGLAESAAVDAIRSLGDLGLARTADDDRAEVAHPLVAEAVLDRLSEAQRRALHARRAATLRACGAPLDDVAAHVSAAGDAVPDGEAVAVLAAAAEQALGRGAGAEALRWLSDAVERARDDPTDPGRLGRLLTAAATAWELEGEPSAAVAAEREATHVLAGVDPAAASRAAARVAMLDWLRGVEDEVDRWGDRAVELAVAAEPLDRLRAEFERCYMAFRTGRSRRADFADVLGAFRRAADAVGDHPDVAAARFAMDVVRAFDSRERLEPLVDRLPLRPGATGTIHSTAVGLALEVLAMLGRWADLEAHAAGATGWRATWARLDAALSTGRWHDADDLLTETLSPAPRGTLAFGVVEAWLAAHRGEHARFERLRRQLDELLDSAPPGLRSYRAPALATELAAALTSGAPVDPDRRLAAFDGPWDAMREPLIRGVQGEWLACAGRVEDARAVADRLRAYGGPATRVGALAARVDGLAARHADPAEATRTLLAAADAFDAAAMPFDAARCVLDAPGEHRERLLAALAVFERIGAEPFAARALRRLGRAPAGTGRRVTLTPRERRVGMLVASGLTNLEIAERLGISIRTVTSHLDHAYTKLGVGSRAALAAYVTAGGQPPP